ncbi:hypothetical protein L1887_00836 [Cichorium endivia]|nr:hypothetical protein L1887_00836 [Cichorium endivia]
MKITINCPFAFINPNRPQIPYLYRLPIAYFDLELGLNHFSHSPVFLQPPVTSPWPGNRFLDCSPLFCEPNKLMLKDENTLLNKKKDADERKGMLMK